MKQRFSSLDLQIISHELSTTLVGHRLSNIYDLTSRIFLLKFAKPDSKHLVVIDSGFRVHLTSFTRETSPTPSSFTSKLRKYLRTRRLTQVQQLGVDRVLKLTFSDGLYHLFLEFFAGGNVILTDAEMNMLAVLRIVPPGEDGTGECKVGAKYDDSGKMRSGPVTKERIATALQEAVEEGKATAEEKEVSKTPGKKAQKKKKKVDNALKKVLGAKLSEFSPVLIEHALLGVGVDPTVKAEQVVENEELLDKVLEAFREAEGIIRDLTDGEGVKKGYIIAKKPQDLSTLAAAPPEKEKKAVAFGSTEAVEIESAEKIQEEGEAKGLVFDDFHPFLPRQFAGVPGVKTLKYEGFNKTVDTFYSSIEAQKLESRLKEREIAAQKRLEAARNDHQKRVEVLRDVQDLNIRKAQTLEANFSRVEEAIAAVNGLIAQGMDWVQAARLIEGEQKRGNAVAEIIQLPLKLYENTITLKLRETEFEAGDFIFAGFSDDEDDETDEERENADDQKAEKPLSIDVDLSLSAFANARNYYDEKRTAAEKETKTLKSSAKALKSTERKVTADLKKGLKTEKQLLRPQNEYIYKRHFRRGDVYVHADINGAASIIVKNNPATPNAPIPPSTLQQAGTLAVATSQAWDSKAVMSAWWVGFEQVSKIGLTGDYLDAGIFNIKGNKNFLPPAQLVMGYGVLWRVDEESKKKHVKHRVGEQKEEKVTEEDVAEQEGEAEGKEKEEDSDEEEFPDAKLESDDDEEAFPDAKIESADEAEPQQNDDDVDSGLEAENEPSKDEDTPDTIPPSSQPESSSFSPAAGASSSGRRHLSAKQHRDLKKGKLIAKRAAKYAHQTDADRELALSILGVTSAQKAAEEKSAETPKETPEARKVRLREQHQRAQAAGLAEEAKRHLQRDIDEDEEDEVATIPLDALIPDPYDDDVVLDAIPVCAPWGAMGRYKWRVKMQPGAQKKGKAIREVWNSWINPSGKRGGSMKGVEKELVGGWKESEWVACVGMSKVKVFGGGGGGGEEKKGSGGKGGGKRGKGSKR
ncbi:fibronectin-binding protein A N-terminus-domain-containing protein [Trichophaea hybrida]|nr:fibronectin-binding protein A N-terminus-domain-containing protein [Trichophaea hybrida]